MSTRTRFQIERDLATLLANFNGREYSDPIGPETLFFGDLGMVSIDAVILAEKLEALYGQKLPFHQFVSQMSQRGVQDLAVGDLAAFLQTHLR